MLQRFFLICLLALTSQQALAQPDTLWSTLINETADTYLLDAVELPDHGFAVCGNAAGDNSDTDIFVARVSADGDVLWNSRYAATNATEEASGITFVDNTLFVVGYLTQTAVNNLFMLGLSLNGDSLWSKTLAPEGLSKGRDAILLNNGNVGVCGYRLGTSNSSDAWLIVCNSNGDTLWSRIYGGLRTDVGQKLFQRDDGSFVMLCNSRSTSEDGDYNFQILDISASGQIEDDGSSFGTADDELGYGLDVDLDGNVWLAGRREDFAGYLARRPTHTNPWSLSVQDGNYTQLHGVIVRGSGALCAGWSGSSQTSTQLLLKGFDEDGTALWSWPIGSPGNGVGLHGIISLTTGGALAFGGADNGEGLRGYLLRIAPAGGVQGMVYDRDSGLPVEGVRVQVVGTNRATSSDQNGNYVLELVEGTYDLMTTGYCFEADTAFGIETLPAQLVTANLSVGVPAMGPGQTSVNLIARNHIESSGNYRLTNNGSGGMSYSIAAYEINPLGDWINVTPAAGVIPPGENLDISVTVLADTTDDGIYDYYGQLIVQTNSCPDTFQMVPVLATVLDAESPAQLPQSLKLRTAYPNPFNSSTRFSLESPARAKVRLELYNIQGQLVRTIANREFDAGVHGFELSLDGQAGGLYLLRMQAENITQTQKLLFLK